MPKYKVKVLETTYLTPEVRCFVVEKPEGYRFEPGQATFVTIAKDGWRDEERPFSFTSLNRDPNLEFMIKIYPERDGVTDRLAQLEIGDELILGEPWGAIEYLGEGVFIAGGAGLTPFIAILRDLQADNRMADNRLIYADTRADRLILNCELKRMLGDRCLFTITDEDDPKHESQVIDREFLKSQINSRDQFFYLCGPPDMIDDVTGQLKSLGVEEEKIVMENFN